MLCEDESNRKLHDKKYCVFTQDVQFSCNIKADSHIACRAHAVPLPCHAVALRRKAWSEHGMGMAWQV